MNRHLDEYLCKKYPKIFADRRKPMQETCMCWGFDCGNGWFWLIDNLCSSIQYYLDNPQYVEPKTLKVKLRKLWNRTIWNYILYPLGRFYYVPRLNNTKKGWEKWTAFQNRWSLRWDYVPGPAVPQVVAAQVKEKFGGLRFYVNGGDEYTRALISFAETLSYSICEKCGRSDELVARSGRGWIQTLCPCCQKPADKDVYKKSLDKDVVKMWEKVRHEESKKTDASRMDDAFKTVKEVQSWSKKSEKNEMDMTINTLKQIGARKRKK